MCGTCGCGETSAPITITLLKDKEQQDQNGGHTHHHHGPDDQHRHDHHHHHHGEHDHHSHTHTHIHPNERVVEVGQDILQQNDVLAARNRGFFEGREILALNLVSSPGSGKTSLLERTLADLKGKQQFSVIEGDQQTFHDANRIAAQEVPVVQINTGKACHLEAEMVHQAVQQLNPARNSILFIENVGNLVCPAMFDLGEHKRVVVISVTEGTDKAIKYPDMFHSSDICIINKIDLLPYVDFDVEKAKSYALQVNHHLKFIEVSATQGTGMEGWYEWLGELQK